MGVYGEGKVDMDNFVRFNHFDGKNGTYKGIVFEIGWAGEKISNPLEIDKNSTEFVNAIENIYTSMEELKKNGVPPNTNVRIIIDNNDTIDTTIG